MNIVSKILLLVIVSISVVMMTVCYLSIHQTQKVVNQQINRLLSDHLEFAKTKIQETTDSIRRTAEIVALDPKFSRGLLIGLSRGLNQILNRVVTI